MTLVTWMYTYVTAPIRNARHVTFKPRDGLLSLIETIMNRSRCKRLGSFPRRYGRVSFVLIVLISCHVVAWSVPVCVGGPRTQTVAFSAPAGRVPSRRRHRCAQGLALSKVQCTDQRLWWHRAASVELSSSLLPQSVESRWSSSVSAWLPRVNFGWKPERNRRRSTRGPRALSMSADVEQLSVLGMDTLVFLAATCAVIPA